MPLNEEISKSHQIPADKWTMKLSSPLPSSSVHTPATPPMLEIFSLLPLAYRIGSHIMEERSEGREPIFDLNGIALQPPHPGPYAGVPCGGIGSGSIGRGYRGDFRRWSVHPGRYIHRIVAADMFSIRVKRNGSIYSQLLTTLPFEKQSCLNSWRNFSNNCNPISPSKVTYHALFPRSWSVFEEPVPGIRVTILQVSPFLPGSYSEASIPAVVFHVDVENTGDGDAEVSVMFSFQNGDGGNGDALGGNIHVPFQTDEITTDWESSEANGSDNKHNQGSIVMGVGQSRQHQTVVLEREKNMIIGTTSSRTEDFDTNVRFQQNQTVEMFEASGEGFESANGRQSSFGWSCGLIRTSQPSRAITSNVKVSGKTRMRRVYNDPESFAIASVVSHSQSIRTSQTRDLNDTAPDEITFCSRFVTEVTKEGILEETMLGPDPHRPKYTDESATELWSMFHFSGTISDCQSKYAPAVSAPGTKTASAVCLKKTLHSGQKKNFPFSLAWDTPIARFGNGKALRKYYTRFFGHSGYSAPNIAAYALLFEPNWSSRIINWQQTLLSNLREGGPHAQVLVGVSQESNSSRHSAPHQIPSYYNHQIFNELYFLVDGGTLWLDSTDGVANAIPEASVSASNNNSSTTTITETTSTEHANQTESAGTTSFQQMAFLAATNSQEYGSHGVQLASLGQVPAPALTAQQLERQNHNHSSEFSTLFNKRRAKPLSLVSLSSLQSARACMLAHDSVASVCAGDQAIVGQFLYLEGHEYLMYNTYDVHFYAGFALLSLFPQLELSLQRDFALCVLREDHSTRNLMYDGKLHPRKVKGCVPHDLGSPSEYPFLHPNAYNFQDVSNWKDLGPKFVLQVYRNYIHIRDRDIYKSEESAMKFLIEVYPAVIVVMKHTERYDLDQDGMIENSGFPDQTYDIWIAHGIHAYCGGLWLTACQATNAMASVMGDQAVAEHYLSIFYRAKTVYINTLWNGFYLNYDSSESDHHDSIMADMLAGHWYCRMCNLPSFLTLEQVLSCLRVIYEYNVVKFGGNKLIGAVNGMKPNGTVDKSCMQSREVWTGTTYGLAATMMQEAAFYESRDEFRRESLHASKRAAEERQSMFSMPTTATTNTDVQLDQHNVQLDENSHRKSVITKSRRSSSSETHKNSLAKELRQMAFNTAQGIHDGGWREFGYWFATPEGWERNGNYRSLGYMRALAIWAIQYSIDHKPVLSTGKNKEFKPSSVP